MRLPLRLWLCHSLVGTTLLSCIPSAVSKKTACGKWYSTDCLGDTDRRYDPDFTLDLKELHPVWGRYEGFWIVEFYRDINPETGMSSNLDFYNPSRWSGSGRPYPAYTGFYNETFVGSRYYSNRYYVYSPSEADFCNLPVPDGFANVVGNGECGVNGYAEAAGNFGTTTYEKDGAIKILYGIGTYGGGRRGIDAKDTPVNDDTFFKVNFLPGLLLHTVTFSFLRNYTEISGSRSQYDLSRPPPSTQLTSTQAFRMIKVSEQEWLAAIEKAYEDSNVLLEDRVQNSQLPMETDCVVPDQCPDETTWCTQDPACSRSPYQEPDADLKAGPIVGFVMLGVVILAAIAYWYYRRQLALRDKQNRELFARRIAQTVRLSGSTRQLTPDALAEEFKRMDKESQNGCITKEQLWEFISSGKAGEMNESDFNAMFAAIDLDKNGTLDFLEFCTYMGQCHDDFERVKNRQSILAGRNSVIERSALRLSVADTAARRLSSVSQPLVPEDVLEQGEEGEEGKTS